VKYRSERYEERNELEKTNSTRKRGSDSVVGIWSAGRRISEMKAGRKNLLF
jgi:hypothetical protein